MHSDDSRGGALCHRNRQLHSRCTMVVSSKSLPVVIFRDSRRPAAIVLVLSQDVKATMDQYKSSYPSTPEVPPSLRQYFEAFYKISDTPEAHEGYVDCFTKDAIVIMASARVEGSDGKSSHSSTKYSLYMRSRRRIERRSTADAWLANGYYLLPPSFSMPLTPAKHPRYPLPPPQDVVCSLVPFPPPDEDLSFRSGFGVGSRTHALRYGGVRFQRRR